MGSYQGPSRCSFQPFGALAFAGPHQPAGGSLRDLGSVKRARHPEGFKCDRLWGFRGFRGLRV